MPDEQPNISKIAPITVEKLPVLLVLNHNKIVDLVQHQLVELEKDNHSAIPQKWTPQREYKKFV
jgi:hypothetical protein